MYDSYQMVAFQSLRDLYHKIFIYLPNLLAAAVVVILGWLVGLFLSKLAVKILQNIKIDTLADQLGLKNLSHHTGKPLSLSAFRKEASTRHGRRDWSARYHKSRRLPTPLSLPLRPGSCLHPGCKRRSKALSCFAPPGRSSSRPADSGPQIRGERARTTHPALE